MNNGQKNSQRNLLSSAQVNNMADKFMLAGWTGVALTVAGWLEPAYMIVGFIGSIIAIVCSIIGVTIKIKKYLADKKLTEDEITDITKDIQGIADQLQSIKTEFDKDEK